MPDIRDLIHERRLFVDGRPVTDVEFDCATGRVELILAAEWEVRDGLV